MMTNPLLALADAAHSWQNRIVSPQLEWDCRRAVLDWFGSMLPGCVEGPVIPLAKALAAGRGQGNAISYADGSQGTARHAAFLNGTASHTAEFDDIYRDGGYHPGSPTISAALAVAQQQGVSADAFRRSVIAGYEVGCRIALALQPSHYRNWHITATVGTFGAAVSTATLMGCDAERIAHAIAIASSFAGGHQENLQGQGQTKPLHSGHAAEAGVLAGLAAAAGVTGSLDSLHAPHGYAAATSDNTGNWDAALAGIGEWTPIAQMTFKNHGCCGHIFPTLDGMRHIQNHAGVTVDEIAAIEIFGYGPTAAICDRMLVENPRDARFSVQYCLSALLHTGNVRLGAFLPETMERADIRQFMEKITVTEDAEIAAAYPRKRMARLKVHLTGGRVIDHFQQTRKGDPDDPLTDAELFEKYDELAGSVLDHEERERLKRLLMDEDILPGSVAIADRHGGSRPNL